MARPIKETPVLRGKNAENFARRMANPAPVSKSEKEDARLYSQSKTISSFQAQNSLSNSRHILEKLLTNCSGSDEPII